MKISDLALLLPFDSSGSVAKKRNENSDVTAATRDTGKSTYTASGAQRDKCAHTHPSPSSYISILGNKGSSSSSLDQAFENAWKGAIPSALPSARPPATLRRRRGSVSQACRDAVWWRDRGICASCGADCSRWICVGWRRGRVITDPLPPWGGPVTTVFPIMVSSWEADHIRPLWSAPADLSQRDWERLWDGLTNLQTLCIPCHRQKSAREASERRGAPCSA